MLSSALVGGALLALIEGVGIVVSHYSADSYRQVSPVERQQRYKQELLRQQKGVSPLAATYGEVSEIPCAIIRLNNSATHTL